MIQLTELPDTVDLRNFSHFLHQQGIAHRIIASGNGQALWLHNAHHHAIAQQWLEQWQMGKLSINPPSSPPKKTGHPYWQTLKRAPVMSTGILLCILVALITHLGTQKSAVFSLTFLKPEFNGFASLSDTLNSGQWWRLFTPALLHFGWTHLIFNMLWLYELGQRIERIRGSIFLLGLILVSDIASNTAQWFFNSGQPLFGGFSGIVYALLGYIWFFHRQHKIDAFALPSGLFWLLVAWLLIGYTGWLDAWVKMANHAHAAGLLCGALLGFIQGKCYHLRHKNS